MRKLSELIRKDAARLKQQMRSLPRLLGNEVVNHTLENFKLGGFRVSEGSFEPWPDRKAVRGRRVFSRRALLVKSGALRRSIRVVSAGPTSALVASRLPYSKRHNEGLKGMPQRKFLGDSRALRKRLKRLIQQTLKKP